MVCARTVEHKTILISASDLNVLVMEGRLYTKQFIYFCLLIVCLFVCFVVYISLTWFVTKLCSGPFQPHSCSLAGF